MFTSFSAAMDAHEIKAHLMNFRFLSVLPFVLRGLFEIFFLAEGHPKNTVFQENVDVI